MDPPRQNESPAPFYDNNMFKNVNKIYKLIDPPYFLQKNENCIINISLVTTVRIFKIIYNK